MIPGFVGGISYMHPWYIGLFAVGMRARELTDRERPVPWAGSAIVGALILLPLAFVTSKMLGIAAPVLKEVACGLLLCAVLVWVGRRPQTPRLLRALQSTPLAFSGQISYSVYLLHSPLLGLANLLLIPLGLNIVLHWTLMTFVAAPIVVGVCYIFYLVVEKRFLNSHQRQVAYRMNPTLSVSQSTGQPKPID